MTTKQMPFLVVFLPVALRQGETPSMMFFDIEEDALRVFEEYTTGYAQWAVLIDPEDKIAKRHGDIKAIDAYVEQLNDIMKRRAELPGNQSDG